MENKSFNWNYDDLITLKDYYDKNDIKSTDFIVRWIDIDKDKINITVYDERGFPDVICTLHNNKELHDFVVEIQENEKYMINLEL
jgi:alanyl-tRNA synthetase